MWFDAQNPISVAVMQRESGSTAWRRSLSGRLVAGALDATLLTGSNF